MVKAPSTPTPHRSGASGAPAVADVERLEHQLAHAQRLSTVGVLAAGVAHEINNILTPVLSYAHLARTRSDDEEFLDRATAKIIAGVESACQVARAILSFTADADRDDQAEISPVLDTTFRCLARDPAKDRIEVVTRIPPGSMVRIQPVALQQVLLNLLLNARAVLKETGGRITIEAAPGPDGTTVLSVTDTGPGIPDDVQASLFEPFVSGRTCSGEGSDNEGGSGLGLTVARYLIERAGGRIAVASAPGTGARFEVVLKTGGVARAKAG
jgi:signal transduction histidine kinase